MTKTTSVQFIHFAWKRLFFDRNHVEQMMDKTTRKALSKFGAYVRRRAMGIIRRSSTISRPGQPPHSHIGAARRSWNRLRKRKGLPAQHGGFKGIREIYFAYELNRKSVIVGPIIANQLHFTNDKHRRPVKGTVPSVLEYGGDITIMEVQSLSKQTWIRADLRSRRRLAGRKIRYRTAHVRARPFMHPALEHELPKLPAMWARAIK